MYVVVYIERYVQPTQPRAAQGAKADGHASGRGPSHARDPTHADVGGGIRIERHKAWGEEVEEGLWYVTVESYASKAACEVAERYGLHGQALCAPRPIGRTPGQGQPSC